MEDKMLGCLFGQAVGDALGMGAEFMTKEMVKYTYPQGLRHYADIWKRKHRVFQPGDYTDDTERTGPSAWRMKGEGKWPQRTVGRRSPCRKGTLLFR